MLREESRAANFLNDGGVRFLRNVVDLRLLSDCVREWSDDDLPALLAEAAAVTTPVGVFDANDPGFQAPGDIPVRITAWLREHGQPGPQTQAQFVRGPDSCHFLVIWLDRAGVR